MASPATQPIRVILIDDHGVVRAGLRMIIQSRAGMDIVGEAGDRVDALALAASERPDIELCGTLEGSGASQTGYSTRQRRSEC